MEKRKVGIVTDSNSGITQKQAEELGITVLAMPFYIDEQLYFEDINKSEGFNLLTFLFSNIFNP